MRTTFTFFFIMVVGLTFASFSFADNAVTLESAIQKGQVKVTVLPYGEKGWEAIQVSVKNISGAKMKIIMPKGTLFVPNITDEQTLITSGDELFALNAGQEKIISRKGYCTELHDHGSTATSAFTLGFSVNQKLMNIIGYIDSLGIGDDYMTQCAVWSITNDNPVGYIVLETDTVKQRLVRKRACALTGQEMPWYNTSGSIVITPQREFVIEPKEITGEIVINSDVPITLQGVVKDAEGKVLYTNPNQSHAPEGETTFDYLLHVEGWEKGTYYVVYTCNGKEIINREFQI